MYSHMRLHDISGRSLWGFQTVTKYTSMAGITISRIRRRHKTLKKQGFYVVIELPITASEIILAPCG